MKEFVVKLLNELNYQKEYNQIVHDAKPRTKHEKDLNAVLQSTYDSAIRIVNQLSEEYNNEPVKGDLISRSVLLEEIKSLLVTVTGLRAGKGILAEYVNQYKNTLLRVIEEQPTAYNDGWIPCSEKLPEVFDNVLICTKEGGRTIGHRCPNQEFGRFYDLHSSSIDDVIAWQPLPEPYQPKGE